MKILAFDCGSRWNGWALVKAENGVVMRCGVLGSPWSGQQHSNTLAEALKQVISVCCCGLKAGADIVAIEKSFAPKAHALQWEETAQVRGAIKSCVLAQDSTFKIIELTAKQVRDRLGIQPLSRLTSKTRFSVKPLRGLTADARVKATVEKLFGCEVAGSHESDALALAWAVGMAE